MIEVVYKDEKQHAKGNEGMFQLPRNVRQIGTTDKNYRIYMEDYVYTFLGRAAAAGEGKEETERCLAVFLGEMKWDAGTGYLFIRGAVLVTGEEISQEHVEFTDAMWQQIHEDAGKYFEGEEIVGWFLGGRMQPMEVSEMLLRVHLKHFGGEKVLMLLDPAEKEEAFFRYENSFMVRQSGFYIYYEKNPQMQNYMIEKSPELSAPQEEEVRDDAVRAFRRIIQKKHSGQPGEEGGRTSVFSYAATACLALAVLTVGVQFYQNYSHNKIPKEVTETASSVVEEKAETKPETTQTPKITAKPEITVTPDVTATSETGEKAKPTPTSALVQSVSPTPKVSTENEIYREESDDRKAEQRVRRQLSENAGAEAQAETSDAAQTPDATQTSAGTENSYVIKPGDTLYQISITRYGTMEKVAEICRANGLTEDEIIYPGQIIVLP